TRNREFHKLHRGGGGQSATHSPSTAAAAAGKAAAVVVVPAVVVDSCKPAAVGVVSGAWRQWVVYRWWWRGAPAEGGGSEGDEVIGGVEGGAPYRSGYGERFWVRRKSSQENFSGGRWLEVAVAGRRPAGEEGERKEMAIWSSSVHFRVSSKTKKLSGMLFYIKLF
nr:hypothetical protein [Tanacetum cinerariifolium]